MKQSKKTLIPLDQLLYTGDLKRWDHYFSIYTQLKVYVGVKKRSRVKQLLKKKWPSNGVEVSHIEALQRKLIGIKMKSDGLNS